MAEQAFDREAALARYTELMQVVETGSGTLEEFAAAEKEAADLDFRAGLEGLKFVREQLSGSWQLQDMSEWESRRFFARHATVEATEGTEAIVWHVNVELPGTKLERRQYHIAIVDGEQRIDVIVNYGPGKTLAIEPYLHHEFDYTVHDGCDHENDYCVLDDPESGEFLEEAMEAKYQLAVQRVMGAKQAE